jgi:O-antigen/teichoic acid export membrane protein
MLVGSASMVLSVLLIPYFLGQLRRPGLLSVLAWVNVVLNLALALWAIPPWAESGAALAVVGAQLVGTLLAFVIYLRLADTPLSCATAPRGSDISRAVGEVRAMLGWRRASEHVS